MSIHLDTNSAYSINQDERMIDAFVVQDGGDIAENTTEIVEDHDMDEVKTANEEIEVELEMDEDEELESVASIELDQLSPETMNQASIDQSTVKKDEIEQTENSIPEVELEGDTVDNGDADIPVDSIMEEEAAIEEAADEPNELAVDEDGDEMEAEDVLDYEDPQIEFQVAQLEQEEDLEDANSHDESHEHEASVYEEYEIVEVESQEAEDEEPIANEIHQQSNEEQLEFTDSKRDQRDASESDEVVFLGQNDLDDEDEDEEEGYGEIPECSVPIIVNCQYSDNLLIPFEAETRVDLSSYAVLFRIEPESIMGCNIEEFFTKLREVMHEWTPFSDDDELVLKVPQLKLKVNEDDVYSRELTIGDLISTFNNLKSNTSDPSLVPSTLNFNIRKLPRFITYFNEISEQIYGGKGFDIIPAHYVQDTIDDVEYNDDDFRNRVSMYRAVYYGLDTTTQAEIDTLSKTHISSQAKQDLEFVAVPSGEEDDEDQEEGNGENQLFHENEVLEEIIASEEGTGVIDEEDTVVLQDDGEVAEVEESHESSKADEEEPISLDDEIGEGEVALEGEMGEQFEDDEPEYEPEYEVATKTEYDTGSTYTEKEVDNSNPEEDIESFETPTNDSDSGNQSLSNSETADIAVEEDLEEDVDGEIDNSFDIPSNKRTNDELIDQETEEAPESKKPKVD